MEPPSLLLHRFQEILSEIHTSNRNLVTAPGPDSLSNPFGGNTEKPERELESMAHRHFKFVVSVQRYPEFNEEERDNAEFLLPDRTPRGGPV